MAIGIVLYNHRWSFTRRTNPRAGTELTAEKNIPFRFVITVQVEVNAS
jgi:hypothetical protein